MTHEIEHERTFLAKELPPGLEKCEHKEIIDIFLPSSAHHPTLRIRKNGDSCKITKKEPSDDDLSVMPEHTTPLTKEEYEEIAANVKGKRFRKVRYFYDEDGVTYEIDVYKDALEGFVVVDVEFPEGVGKDELKMPSWCLADVTQEEFVAGGYVAERSYEDIEKDLARFKYKRL